MNNEEVLKMTGQNNSQAAPTMVLNEISINGNDGTIQYKNQVDRQEGEKPEVTELGKSINVVLLKERRKMQFFDSKLERYAQTIEHNTKFETVQAFVPNGDTYNVLTGDGDSLYEQDNRFRTVQVVYALYGENKEVVRIHIKGLSLKSDEKATGYYDYKQSLGDKPMYSVVTKIASAGRETKSGVKYGMDFTEATEVKDTAYAIEKLKEVHAYTEKLDAHNRSKLPQTKEESKEYTQGTPLPKEKVIEYPTEEINPDDIPF